jgi:hypothetical protein
MLSRHGSDVAAATDEWFGAQDPRPTPIAIATPVHASPPPPVSNHLSVTVPAGWTGGAQIQVQAPDGRLLVAQVPEGLSGGDQFLVQMPPPGVAPAQAVGASQEGQPRRTVVHHHYHQSPHYVGVAPYYGGCHAGPYPYYDPVLPAAAGFLGGMLVADALFW